jgi:uncharacterized protein (DUF2461 family)
MTTPTRLSGFSPAATEFFEDLEDQNTREFWLAHKDVFDREIRDPMLRCWIHCPRNISCSRLSDESRHPILS